MEGETKLKVMAQEMVKACAYLGRRHCVANGDCELWCKDLAQKMKDDVGHWITTDVKGKGKQHELTA